jgi:hypothetical protein
LEDANTLCSDENKIMYAEDCEAATNEYGGGYSYIGEIEDAGRMPGCMHGTDGLILMISFNSDMDAVDT